MILVYHNLFFLVLIEVVSSCHHFNLVSQISTIY